MTEERLQKIEELYRRVKDRTGESVWLSWETIPDLIQALRAERERGKALEEGLRSLIGDVEDGIKLREYRKLLSREASGWPEFWPPPWVESEE